MIQITFFREIFTHMDNNHPWIYLKGILSQQMKFILDFVYQGEVEVPEDDLPDFLSSAGDLKIQGLTKYANGGVLSALDSIGDHDNNQIIEKNDFVDLEAANNTNTDNDGSNEVELTDHLVITEEEQEASVMATENFIEVNAELDKQIEDILVKSNGVWTCKACGKSANHKSKLKQHVETHIDGFSHPCGICGKSYRSRNVLRMHLSRDHRNKKNNKQKLFL